MAIIDLLEDPGKSSLMRVLVNYAISIAQKAMIYY